MTRRPYTPRGSRGPLTLLSVRVAADAVAALEARAAELGISRALAVEMAIRGWQPCDAHDTHTSGETATTMEEPMSRQILAHLIAGDTGHMAVTADDRDPTCGNAAHEYKIELPDGSIRELQFQKGPVKERGANGVQDSALLAILIDRFEGFQEGPFASETNEGVLAHLRASLDLNLQRTRDRVARGVEGQSKA